LSPSLEPRFPREAEQQKSGDGLPELEARSASFWDQYRQTGIWPHAREAHVNKIIGWLGCRNAIGAWLQQGNAALVTVFTYLMTAFTYIEAMSK
jgi:hypothetical protein